MTMKAHNEPAVQNRLLLENFIPEPIILSSCATLLRHLQYSAAADGVGPGRRPCTCQDLWVVSFGCGWLRACIHHLKEKKNTPHGSGANAGRWM